MDVTNVETTRLVGVREAAVILGRSEKAVRRMWEKGTMPKPVRIDSRLQWYLRDISSLMKTGEDVFLM